MSPGPLRPPQRTLHLHAGPHKTASTYLQARLHANRPGLEREGLRYPTPWRERSHRNLARALQAGRFDLIISDILMPVMDGFELCRIMRANPALEQTRIMLLTARGREREVARGLPLGADASLPAVVGLPWVVLVSS